MTSREEELFFELHEGLPQQGPGSRASTERAWHRVAASLQEREEKAVDILDVGCGPGRQTRDLLELSEHLAAEVTAVDLYEQFLDQLAENVTSPEASNRLVTHVADMAALPFPDESFDVLWSEGAIYILGFHRGLTEWKRLLRPGGLVAVTEISWLTEQPPEKAVEFWSAEYPGMQSVEANLRTVRECGYTPIEHFALPDSDWWEGYYGPLEDRARLFAERHPGDPEAQAVLAVERAEIDLFRRHSDSYGYVFYIARV